METTIHKMAVALRDAAAKFSSPVAFYVEPEAASRFNDAHPDEDALTDHPDKDWGLESWKILARATLPAIREPTEAQYDALSALGEMWRDLNSTTVWRTYIDAALNDDAPPLTGAAP